VLPSVSGAFVFGELAFRGFPKSMEFTIFTNENVKAHTLQNECVKLALHLFSDAHVNGQKFAGPW
jgi:hypothetical protein